MLARVGERRSDIFVFQRELLFGVETAGMRQWLLRSVAANHRKRCRQIAGGDCFHRGPILRAQAWNLEWIASDHLEVELNLRVGFLQNCHHFLQVEKAIRSEEHTSELQSRLHLVCRLLLEKKKKI